MPESVLITGIGGFLGSALAERAKRAGVRCIGLGRAPRDGADYHALDMTAGPGHIAALLRSERPAIVFHLAGGPAADPFAANVGPMRHLLAAVRSIPEYRPRTIVTGSAAEYGDLGPAPIAEDSPERPVQEYGVAKLAQTRLALTGRRWGLPVTVARLFNVIGAGMATSLAAARFATEARRAMEAGREWMTVGDLGTVRDYVELGDVAEALWALGHVGYSEEIVNVCSGQPVTTRQVLDEILSQLGVRLEARVDPALVQGPADVPVSVGCPGRLEAVTGREIRFSLRSAISQLLAQRAEGATEDPQHRSRLGDCVA